MSGFWVVRGFGLNGKEHITLAKKGEHFARDAYNKHYLSFDRGLPRMKMNRMSVVMPYDFFRLSTSLTLKPGEGPVFVETTRRAEAMRERG